MKKLFIFLVSFAFMHCMYAQQTSPCDPGFGIQLISPGNTIQVTPVINTSNNEIHHTWKFGDGSSPNFTTAPSHSYSTGGVYVVRHIIYRSNSAGALACIDSADRSVTIVTPCNLTAAFVSTVITGTLNVQFTNSSAGFNTGDSLTWNFGDGTVSHALNPLHTYTTPGTYNVCLRVRRNSINSSACVSEICHQVVITAPADTCHIQPFFTYHTDGNQPNHFIFTNTSIGTLAGDSVTWSFGDGSYAYTYNTNHVYTAGGNYTVCLTIKRNNISNTIHCMGQYCTTISVTLPAVCNLSASFYDSAEANSYTHLFYNTTSPASTADSVRWTFGDGSSSNAQNPVHTYQQPGTYNVCLRVQKRNPNGILTNCISETCRRVVIQQVCNIIPAWTYSATASNPLLVTFTNNTPVSAAASATWDFGDGSSGTGWNQTHSYAQPGSYNVCLRIQSGNCLTYKCAILVVNPLPVPCSQSANFHTLTPSAAGNSITVTPNNISSNVQYTWTFGDGTGSHRTTASHTYAAAGTYTVCLTAYRNDSCAATSCMSMQVPNCNYAALSFNDHRDSLAPNRITFTAISNYTITDQVWTITKIPATAGTGTVTIHSNNPTYVFTSTGYYKVCLRATLAGGCVKTFCKEIYISQTTPQTNNCSLQVYPNPATTEINAVISLTQPLLINAYLYNSLNVLVGQKQQQGVAGMNTVSMNIANLPAGIYILKLVCGNQVCYATFVK